MKKVLLLGLSLSLLVALTACGQDAQTDAQSTEPTSGSTVVESSERTEPAKPVEITELLGEMAYGDLTEEQLALFEETGKVGIEDIKSYAITMDLMEMNQDDLIKGYIEMNKLTSNGVELFHEWKAKTNYYSQFEKDILTDNMRNENGTSILDEQKPDVQTPSENNNNNQKPVTPPVTPDPGEYTPPVTPNKPVKTPEQVEQQKPSNNNDSGIPLTPEEIREAFEGMTDGSDGSSTFDDSTHGYDVEGW